MSLKAASAPNIVRRLSRWAAERPLAPAVVDGGRTISFGGLDDEAARLGAGLQSLGLGKGTRVVLMVPPGVEMLALAFALFRIGAVPVFVDPGVGWSHLRDCLGQAAPEAFIGSPKAHLGRVLGGWAKSTLKTFVVAQGFFPGAIGLGAVRRGAGGLRAPEETAAGAPAAIMYTSGSTGTPKGAVYTHEMLDAQCAMLRDLFSIEAGQASVPTFPLFMLFDVMLGLTVHLPKMDFTKPGSVDPEEILGKVNASGAAQLFGSPALIDRVGKYAAERGRRMPSLKRVLSAGAPVPAKVLSRFAGLIDAQVHTPYGATEALPVASIGSAELAETAAATAAGKGVCVGRPVPGVTARVIAVTAEAIGRWDEGLARAQGEVGEICVKGPVVSREYFRKPEATAAAKIPDGDGFWHRMGDLGYFDGEGRLWFCGRKTERVVTGDGVLDTACVEGVFNTINGLKRCAVVGWRGQAVLYVETESGKNGSLEDELRATALRHELTRGVARFVFKRTLPVDKRHNAKIKRDVLAAEAARTLA